MQFENLYRLEIEDIKESTHHLILDSEKAYNLFYMLEKMLRLDEDKYQY